jgi:ComF family protein
VAYASQKAVRDRMNRASRSGISPRQGIPFMADYIEGAWKKVLDLFFPPRCVGCDQEGHHLCPTCLAAVARVKPPWCALCGRPLSRSGFHLCSHCLQAPLLIDGIRSVGFFEGVLREAIHQFKYEGLTVLSEPLGKLAAEGWRSLSPVGDVIVPVPLHARRVRERGYNQSALLARELGRRVGLPVLENALTRTRETAPQVDLNAQQRHANVADAFECVTGEICGHAVLLVDDVCTTGATLNACAEALRKQEPRSIWALTLARAR